MVVYILKETKKKNKNIGETNIRKISEFSTVKSKNMTKYRGMYMQ